MNYAEICIIKRDGKREDFSISKIKNAIGKAFHASGIDNEDKLIAEITMRVISNFVSPTISVEEIQDLVEKELMKVRPEVAKKYIIYREWRNTEQRPAIKLIQFSLADSLKNKIIPEMKNKHLHVIYKKFPDEVHGTIALPAIFDGLKSLFHSTISTKEAT